MYPSSYSNFYKTCFTKMQLFIHLLKYKVKVQIEVFVKNKFLVKNFLFKKFEIVSKIEILSNNRSDQISTSG